MAEHGGLMPPASRRGGGWRSWRTGLVLVVAAVVGALLVVVLWPGGSPGPTPSPSTSAPDGGAVVSGCAGGSDPVAAVVAAAGGPATPEGAAEMAAAVVRFTESKAFGSPAALETIKAVADPVGSPKMVELQRGQAPYVAQMTATAARVGRGAFSVLPEPLTPTVTVLTPVEWSTSAAAHNTWRYIDVRLLRTDRWTVVSADPAQESADDLEPLRGAEVKPGDLDRVAGALATNGFRRYSGDC